MKKKNLRFSAWTQTFRLHSTSKLAKKWIWDIKSICCNISSRSLDLNLSENLKKPINIHKSMNMREYEMFCLDKRPKITLQIFSSHVKHYKKVSSPRRMNTPNYCLDHMHKKQF